MRKIPPEIERIFDKPGSRWTDRERYQVKEWLFEPPQLQFLLFKGLRYLRTSQNAEDAWGKFYLKRLDQKSNLYDPSKGLRFWSYLLLQFQYFCLDESKKLPPPEVALGGVKNEEGEAIEFQLVDKRAMPQEIVERKLLVEALNECVDDLSAARREVVSRFYFEELSIKETAKKLGVSQGAVKGRLHHARHNLRDCLKGKGWLS